MKVLDVALKSFREQVRQRKTLAITLGLPLVFLGVFSFAFGGSDHNETFALAVVNDDTGNLGARYVDALRDLAYEDGTPLFEVTLYDVAEDAREPVERRAEDALLVIPANFSEGLAPTMTQPGGTPVVGAPPERGPPRGTHVDLTGDPSFPDFATVSRIVDAFTRAFAAEATGRSPAIVVNVAQVTSQELTAFDYIAPGLMVFAILNTVPAAAAFLARESESGTLDRVRQSPTSAFTLLAGVTLAQVAIASVTMALMLAGAVLLGFHNQGSFALAYVIALATALASVGLGMIVAGFAKDQSEAANMGSLVAVPLSFLSGAFFDLPAVTLFTWRDRAIGVYDLIPTAHGVDALRAVLTFGRGTDAVAASLGALVLLGLALFGTGVMVYRRMRLDPA